MPIDRESENSITYPYTCFFDINHIIWFLVETVCQNPKVLAYDINKNSRIDRFWPKMLAMCSLIDERESCITYPTHVSFYIVCII
jgi:hypothetical protein